MSQPLRKFELWWVTEDGEHMLRIADDIGHPELLESAVRQLGQPAYVFHMAVRFDEHRVFLDYLGAQGRLIPAEDGAYAVTDGRGKNYGWMRVDHNLQPITTEHECGE
jgi:hypothetical protein